MGCLVQLPFGFLQGEKWLLTLLQSLTLYSTINSHDITIRMAYCQFLHVTDQVEAQRWQGAWSGDTASKWLNGGSLLPAPPFLMRPALVNPRAL